MDNLEFDLDKVEALNFDTLVPQLQYILNQKQILLILFNSLKIFKSL